MAELMTSTLIGSLIQLSGKFRQMLASLTTPWPADMQKECLFAANSQLVHGTPLCVLQASTGCLCKQWVTYCCQTCNSFEVPCNSWGFIQRHQ